MPDFLPRKGASLGWWARNFANHIAASPQTYALAESDAQAMESACTAYETALALTKDPAQRCTLKVIEKDSAAEDVKRIIRRLVKRVRSVESLTPEMLQTLGLKAGTRRRVKPKLPAEPPTLYVTQPMPGRIELTIRPTTGSLRARPRGAIGAVLVYAVREKMPTDPSGWSIARMTTRLRTRLVAPPSSKYQTVWYAAAWVSARLRIGVPSAPVSIQSIGGAALHQSEQRAA